MSEEKEKRDWREKRSEKSFTVSASQLSTFLRCPRAWWLEKVRGLKTPTSHSQAKGTVLHAVAERYQLADDQGLDENGLEVDLYPEDWHIAKNRYGGVDGEINASEQALIKRLVSKAIEEGVLERKPGREVEAEFKELVLVTPDGTEIYLEGFIDLLCSTEHDLEVDDHKTSKTRKYLLSKAKLKENLQMLVYAWVCLRKRRESGLKDPEHVTLRHNQYVVNENDPFVKKTVVHVSVAEVEDFWTETIEPALYKMHRIRKNAESWSSIPEPEDRSKACMAYGGCPFMDISDGKIDEKGYEERLDKPDVLKENLKLTLNGKPLTKERGSKMAAKSLAEILANRKSGAPSAGTKKPTTSAAPKKDAVKKEQPPKKEEPKEDTSTELCMEQTILWTTEDGTEMVLAPWSDPDNRSSTNGGVGVTKNGKPCAMAAAKGAKATPKRPSPDMFDLEVLEDDGCVLWQGKEGTPVEGTMGYTPLSAEPPKEVESSESVETPSSSSKAKAVKEEEEEEEEDGEQEEEPQAQEGEEEQEEEEDGDSSPQETVYRNRPPGRPQKSFVLLIGCVMASDVASPSKKNMPSMIEDLLEDMYAMICEAKGVESVYQIQVFDRREIIEQLAPEFAESIRKKVPYICAMNLGSGASDAKILLDSLKPFASNVIVGVSC